VKPDLAAAAAALLDHLTALSPADAKKLAAALAKAKPRKSGPAPRGAVAAGNLNIRANDEERKRWSEAQALEGAETLTAWIRATLDARAAAVAARGKRGR